MREEFNRRYILNMMSEGYSLYFAYGEEINIEKMTSLCPKSVAVGHYVLKDYRFSLDENGYPNALKSKVSSLEGILWLIEKESLEELKSYKKGFEKEFVNIYLGDKPYKSFIYISLNPGKYKINRVEMIKQMIVSAKFWRFSPLYVSYLDSFVARLENN
ncbi:MAG: gamma-glutamylcyclotransferase family protein [Sphaerochaetaceae bacterium]|nr:gamma-glutamylcyclotransferase [Sphaerochaetaceae bacterium]